MRYSVRENIGKHALTVSDGQKVYDFIFYELKAGNSVELDFENIHVIVSGFLSASIGQLLKDFTPMQLNQYLHVNNFPLHFRHLLDTVIANAKQYYSV